MVLIQKVGIIEMAEAYPGFLVPQGVLTGSIYVLLLLHLWFLAQKFLFSFSHSQFRAGSNASELNWWGVIGIEDYWERIWETDDLACDDPFRNV